MSFGSTADSAKEQVKRAVDIVDLIGDYVHLRREGRGYKGLCPWHDDAHPSLQVNPERQSFKCYVCNFGGDVFSFMMKQENVEFREALEMLADRAGIVLDGSGKGRDRQLLYQAMAWAEQQFHECLLRSDEARPAREYLADRKITQESIERFRLGYSPDSWDWILAQARQTRFTPQVLAAVGLAKERTKGPGYYDPFHGRVLFPIRDVQSRPIALGGRILPGVAQPQGIESPGNPSPGKKFEGPKYYNSPETAIFHKGNTLYGLDVAKDAIAKGKSAMVMEGYTDCLVAQQSGLSNAVAVLGTALGEQHIKLLKRFTDRVMLVLDGDEAGRRRSDQILELFVAQEVELQILTLPDNLDPADFLLEQGGDAFRELFPGALDAVEFRFQLATAGLNAQSGVHEYHRAAEQILATLAKAPRLSDATTSHARLRESQVLAKLAALVGVGEEVLRQRLADLRRQQARKPAYKPSSAAAKPQPTGPGGQPQAPPGGQPQAPSPDGSAAAQAPPPEAEPLESTKFDFARRELLEIVIAEPQFLGQVREEIAADEFRSPRERAVYRCCCQLADRGREPNLERLLLEIEDAQLKTLLIELADSHQAKNRSDLAAVLNGLLTVLRDHREEQRSRARRKEANRPASEEEELDALIDIIQRKRRRQGISAPTDG
ncbi:MAG TPA: DNA primase [Pirellulales bacterium]|nr:DNA primase [Pirellulales bacterium]